MPRVSVIVPAFDAAAHIDETIASVVSQSLDDWELTVVDDGSTDGSAGVAAARNAGFAASHAAAEYLLFLDADDRLEASALETMTGYLDRHPDIGMVHCGYTLVDGQGRRIQSGGEPWTPRWVPSGRWIRKLDPDEPDTPFVSV